MDASAWPAGNCAARLSGLLLVALAATAHAGTPAEVRRGEARACSDYLASHPATAISPAEYRRCVVAIAGTYLQWSQHEIPDEAVLLADDVAVHYVDEPANFAPGNRARVLDDPAFEQVGKLWVENWTVEGEHAVAVYSGSLASAPSTRAYWVIERFTIEHGRIREVAGALHAAPH